MEDSLVLRALEVLKRACKDLQGRAAGGGDAAEDEPDSEDQQGDDQDESEDPCESPSMKALLILHSESQDSGLLSADPALYTLSNLLARLQSLYLSSCGKTPSGDGASAGSFLGGLAGGIGALLSSLLDLHLLLLPRKRRWRRRSGAVGRCHWNCREISRVAGSIESEIQSWIDRERLGRLVSALRLVVPSSSSSLSDSEEESLAGLLMEFEDRLSRGFDRGLQDAVLRSGAFPAVAAVLADPTAALRLRERCAHAVAAMVQFNRDVFVGHVLMGGGGGDPSSLSALRSLAAMGTPASMRVLRSLVAAIKIALVDELHADDQIPGFVGSLSLPDADTAAAALELLLQVAYYARKETVDSMIQANVVKRLVVLQRSDLGGALIEMDDEDAASGCCGGASGRRPFASCVARLAIQIEVGEGLRRRERAAAKVEIVERVRDAAASEAEAATIVAEVLWGASP